MKKMQQGFTLIELMIVVAIIGILAAVALPAYQDYVVKSRVSEVIMAASAARTAVSEAAANEAGTTMPTTAAIESQASTYVTSVSYASGAITAVAKGLGGDAKDGDTIVLRGTKASNGQVTWTCGGSIPEKYRPASCKGGT